MGGGACGRYSRRDARVPGQIAPRKVNNRCPAARRGTAMRTHEKHIRDAHGRGATKSGSVASQCEYQLDAILPWACPIRRRPREGCVWPELVS